MDHFNYRSQTPNSSSSSSSSSFNNNKSKTANTKHSTSKLSTDPQSVAARERRHRISDRFKILQSMVPGGSKMDTVSMLDEAISYVKLLQAQIWFHQNMLLFCNDHDITSSSTYPPHAGEFGQRLFGYDDHYTSVMETYLQLQGMPPTVIDSEYPQWFGWVDDEQELGLF